MIPETVQKSAYHFEKDLKYDSQKSTIKLKDGSDAPSASIKEMKGTSFNVGLMQLEKQQEQLKTKKMHRQSRVEDVIFNTVMKEVYNKDSTTHWLIRKPIWRVSRVVNLDKDFLQWRIYWMLEDTEEAEKYRDQLEYVLQKWEPYIHHKVVPQLNLRNAPKITFYHEDFKNITNNDNVKTNTNNTTTGNSDNNNNNNNNANKERRD